MNNIFLWTLVVLVFGSAVKGQECDDLKILKVKSATKEWFDLKFTPFAHSDKVKTVINGAGWKSSRKDEEVEDVKTFTVEADENQLITVKAADQSEFSLEHFGIKTKNCKEVRIFGIASNGDQVYSKVKVPKTFDEEYPEWRKVRFGKQDGVISRLMVQITLHDEVTEKKKSHKISLRGLKVKACPE